MDLLQQINQNYQSSDEEQQPDVMAPSVPEKDIQALALKDNLQKLTRFETENEVQTKQNHLTGFLDSTIVSKHDFQRERLEFEKTETKKSKKQIRRENKQKRQNQGKPEDEDFKGPWALYEGMEEFKKQDVQEPTPEQQETIKKYQEMRAEQAAEPKKRDQKKKEAEEFRTSTVFHGQKAIKFTEVPQYLQTTKSGPNYIPKKWVHTFQGHAKGVQKVKFFPKSGHLMLSASHDGSCKIWDLLTNKKCLRTYIGHSKAIRDVDFNNDGTKFLSAGFDRQIHLWDTETGKVIRSFSNNKTPFCVKFHPTKQNLFLAGCSNKKIVQFDVNQKEIVQQYEEHMGSINTITFIDYGKRFVSTSDDKKIYIWEFGIPVVAKHISEPDMNSIPAATLHPSGTHWAGQSMDEKIKIYDCGGNFKLNRSKTFSGHKVQGFACGLKFSPDGQFLASGDAEGRVFFWNYKTCKNYRTIQCHEGVCIDLDWHPQESSKLLTCGWDGTIKLWD